jgi:hypothetical protein
MSLLNLFYRVSRREPCRICGKPDWCMSGREGGRYEGCSLCKRIESEHLWRDAGWFHGTPGSRVGNWGSRPFRVDLGLPRRLDLPGLIREAQRSVTEATLDTLSLELGVSGQSLFRLGLGRARGPLATRIGIRGGRAAWLFPMRKPNGEIVGARVRTDEGRKFAIAGGRDGLFLPADVALDAPRLAIAEGPSDVAALLDLGVPTIGRPSATGGTRHLAYLARRGSFDQIVVFGDNGAAGSRGAFALASTLRLYSRDVRVVFPPSALSDARDWVRAGGSRLEFERMVESATELQFGEVRRV